jgi:hypothetical protein
VKAINGQQLEIAMVKATMNSLGDTVLRTGKRQGAISAEEQGEQGREESFTSDAGASGTRSRVQSTRKKRKEREQRTVVPAQQAFSAAQSANGAPFTAEESVIVHDEDPTIKVVSDSSEVECVLEELPPSVREPGVLFGHNGWVAGGDPEVNLGTEDGGEGESRSVGQKGAGERVPVPPRSSAVREAPATAVPELASNKGRQKDGLSLDSSSGYGSGGEEGPGGISEVQEWLGNVGKRTPEVPRAGGGASSQLRQPHVPLLDARPPRSELKAERRSALKKQQEERKQGKAKSKGEPGSYDDWVDSIRQANPFEPAAGKVVIWSRSSVNKALAGVGVTYLRWRASSGDQQQALHAAAVAWLEANKPKQFFEQGRYRVVEAPPTGEGSPGISRADISGSLEGEGSEGECAEEMLSRQPNEQGEDDCQRSERGPEEKREGGERETSDSDGQPAAKRANTSSADRSHSSTRAARRRELAEHRREDRRASPEELSERKSLTPRALGRAKQAELDKHKRLTRERERAKRDVRSLIDVSLLQQHRQRVGKRLTREEEQLAAFAKTLSPAKLLGAGFRLTADATPEIMPEEDEDALKELMEETGCERDTAKEALDLSCDWTESGRPSRLKAAQWVLSQASQLDEGFGAVGEVGGMGKAGDHDGGGRVRPNRGDFDKMSPRARTSATSGQHAPSDRGTAVDAGNAMEPKNQTNNRKSAVISASRRERGSSQNETRESSTEQSDSNSYGSLTESLSSEVSSDSERSCSSDSGFGAPVGRTARKRNSRGAEVPFSSHRSSRTEAKRAARYVRQLALALKIDSVWAKEIYDECAAQGTTSYDGLLQFFYRREVEHAKGTQRETTQALGVMQSHRRAEASGTGGEFNVNMPTFQLPEWGAGQPPHGGVHFATLQTMLEAYEKYDKQTNFKTQVTFKSMVKDMLKPNFESKCKMPDTVWLPPREDDWLRVANGESERGGWSDMRFLKRARRMLRPKGRTNYEIAFEKMALRHRGNDEQLTVNLDLWGTKWLAKEREAAEEGKALPALKMKSYFKKAVAAVPRFRRWLEGREFTSCKDWYGVLCRKLHKSLGRHAEAAYDKEREAEGSEPGEYSRGGGVYRGGRGGGANRGGGAYRGGIAPTGMTTGTGRAGQWPGNFRKFSESSADARANAHTAGGTVMPHSGGVEPMQTDRGREAYKSERSVRGSAPGRGDVRSSFSSAGRDRANRGPVNPVAEESKEKLPKGPRWHDSRIAACGCRDPDCGTRQDCPYCQGCGMHGHDRPYCFKAGEPQFNPTGYWCVNRPDAQPIVGLGKKTEGASAATSRSNLMDASS